MKNLLILRKSINKTQAEVAKDIGITRSSYQGYESGKNEPDHLILKRMARYFKTTTDYLLDLTDDSTPVVYREETPNYYFSTNSPNFAKLSEEEKRAIIDETNALAERLTAFFEKKGKK